MEVGNYTEVDFSSMGAAGRNMPKTEISVIANRVNSSIKTIVNTELSKDIIDGGYLYLRVFKSDYCDDVMLVFNRTSGIKLKVDNGTRVILSSAVFGKFLLGTLGYPLDKSQRIHIGRNISNDDKYMTFRITKQQ